jgi:hypothetical protein
MRYGYNSNNLYTPTEKRKILLDWGNFLIQLLVVQSLVEAICRHSEYTFFR